MKIKSKSNKMKQCKKYPQVHLLETLYNLSFQKELNNLRDLTLEFIWVNVITYISVEVCSLSSCVVF